jgi:hypothetical protein
MDRVCEEIAEEIRSIRRGIEESAERIRGIKRSIIRDRRLLAAFTTAAVLAYILLVVLR